MRQLFARLAAALRAGMPLLACAAIGIHAARAAGPTDVQLAGQPAAARAGAPPDAQRPGQPAAGLGASVGASSLMAPVQNIYGRSHLSLNGRWSYIIDPYENGYYDYRHTPFDASASGKGGFYDDR